MRFVRLLVAALAAAAALLASWRPCAAATDVTRATLPNGLRVIVVRDTLAPVVTTMLNYLVGSDEQWIDGLAHATEHMMFRGSSTLSSSSLMDVMGVTGGNFDADTQANVTQYFFTVPSQYLDIALRVERSRASGLLMAPDQWAQERGAITQEVTQDNSNAIYRLFVRMENRLIAGTPYAKNGLGTVRSFAKDVDSAQLLKFYHQWYHPNNAVYVIVGDVDGPATVRKVEEFFGDLPSAKLPPRSPVVLRPLRGALYHDTSDQSYTAVLLGYRMPGYQSPDYAASQILGDVLSSPRSTFGGLGYTGKALGTQFFTQTYPKIGLGIAFAAVPVSTKPQTIDADVRALFAQYRQSGVPADLVEAAKLREISQLEFGGNSISGLADEWSDAVAVAGLRSPDDMIVRFENVTPADVDRVMRAYMKGDNVVAAYAVPKNAGAASSGGPGLHKENNVIPPSKHEPLPSWAQGVLDRLAVPAQTLSPSDVTLSNGIRLIVQPEHVTHTVVVAGQILANPNVQEPPGQDGVADVTAGMLPYGTTTYDRLGLQRELDKVAATTSAGTEFGLQVLSSHFERGLALLADEELHPALTSSSFSIVREQLAGELSGEMTSPDHLAAVALSDALYPPGDSQRRFATPQSVGALKLADVKSWYASAYRPDLSTIVVIGDTTPEAARTLVERYFGGWQAAGAKPNVYASPVPPNAPGRFTVPATGRVQSTVQMVETIALARTDPDWARLQLANAVLTGGFYSSLLYHDLREVHGYAYYVDSRFSVGRTRGTFGVSYGSDPSNVNAAAGQVVAVLRSLQERPIDAERLLRSKALLMGDLPIRQASYDGVAEELLDDAQHGLALNQSTIDAGAELSATAADVQAALAKVVRPDGFVQIVVGPASK